MKHKAASRAFTLIEVLLAVAIIAILASLVVPRFVGRGQQAKVAAAKMEILGSLSTALDTFEMDTGSYPTGEQGLSALVFNTDNIPGWKGPYVKLTAAPTDPWGTPHKYTFPAPGDFVNTYELVSAGPDRQFGTEDDLSNLTPQDKSRGP